MSELRVVGMFSGTWCEESRYVSNSLPLSEMIRFDGTYNKTHSTDDEVIACAHHA